MIDGIGPDAPVIVTSGGGKHAASPYAFELVPAVALFEVARTLADGARKYGVDNWRHVPINDNLGHALQHVYGYLAGDISDDHLAHAACRILFALELSSQTRAGLTPALPTNSPWTTPYEIAHSEWDKERGHYLNEDGPRGLVSEPPVKSGAGSSPAAGPFVSDEWRKDLGYLAPCLN